MGRRRVSENDGDFDTYINNTAKVLEAGSPIGSVRLGLSNNEKNEWLAFRDRWNLLYPKYIDLSQRTRAIKEDKNELKKKFTLFAAKPLGKIALSTYLTNEDRATFNLPARKTTRTPRGSMTGDIPIGGFVSIGGGMIRARVRNQAATGRPRKHHWADAVELRYLFVDVQHNFTNPRVQLADATHTLISTKASFRIEVDLSHLGKRMLIFMRWVNFSNPAHNSGWSMVENVIVG